MNSNIIHCIHFKLHVRFYTVVRATVRRYYIAVRMYTCTQVADYRLRRSNEYGRVQFFPPREILEQMYLYYCLHGLTIWLLWIFNIFSRERQLVSSDFRREGEEEICAFVRRPSEWTVKREREKKKSTQLTGEWRAVIVHHQLVARAWRTDNGERYVVNT